MMRKDCISHLTIPMDKTRWLALIFLLMLTNIHYGAERIDSTKAKYSMSLTLSAIANIYPAIQLGHAVQISDKLSIGLETGYIFTYATDNTDFYKSTRGFRLRPEMRMKTSENPKREVYFFYNYRYVKSDVEHKVSKGNGAYTEVVRGDFTRLMHGPGVGMDRYYSLGDGYFKTLKVGMGIGFAFNSTSYSDPIFQRGSDIFTIFSPENFEYLPIIFFHLSLPIF